MSKLSRLIRKPMDKNLRLFEVRRTMISCTSVLMQGVQSLNQINAKRATLARNSMTYLTVPSFGFAKPPNPSFVTKNWYHYLLKENRGYESLIPLRLCFLDLRAL